MGVDAVEDVLDEDLIGAVAGRVRVVGAANAEQEGVQALGNNIGARKSLNCGNRRGGGGTHSFGAAAYSFRAAGSLCNLRSGLRGLGGLSSLGAGMDRSASLSDRADSGRHSDGNNRGGDRAGRAVRDSLSTAGDGRDEGGENSRCAQEAGDKGASMLASRLAGRLLDDLGRGVLDDRGGTVAERRQSGRRRRRGCRRSRGLNSGGAGRSLDCDGGRRGGLDALGLRRGSRHRCALRLSRRLGSGLGRLGAGRAALERDCVNVNAAGWLRLVGLGREDDGDVLGATALVVLDRATGLGAAGAVLAGRTIGHVVVELQVAVELGLDTNGAQRELVNVGSAAEGRRLLLHAAAGTADLLSGCARCKTLGVIRPAGESLPVEVVIA